MWVYSITKSLTHMLKHLLQHPQRSVPPIGSYDGQQHVVVVVVAVVVVVCVTTAWERVAITMCFYI